MEILRGCVYENWNGMELGNDIWGLSMEVEYFFSFLVENWNGIRFEFLLFGWQLWNRMKSVFILNLFYAIEGYIFLNLIFVFIKKNEA